VVLSAQFQSVGERRDSLYANTILSEYAVTDISAQFKGIPNWTPFIAVNNIFDANYELASSYTKGSRTFIAGLTYKID
jgi:outer membrane receptor protein involved in Fe transport